MEFWIGQADAQPAHWDGRKRRCLVRTEVQLPSGAKGYLVAVSPALPGFATGEGAVIAPRSSGIAIQECLERAINVRVCRMVERPDANGAFGDGDLTIERNADAAPTKDAVPDEPDHSLRWERAVTQIQSFIAENGHSHVPNHTPADRGFLDIIVNNLRRHHADARVPDPYPGVDWQADLNRIEGWSWD